MKQGYDARPNIKSGVLKADEPIGGKQVRVQPTEQVRQELALITDSKIITKSEEIQTGRDQERKNECTTIRMIGRLLYGLSLSRRSRTYQIEYGLQTNGFFEREKDT